MSASTANRTRKTAQQRKQRRTDRFFQLSLIITTVIIVAVLIGLNYLGNRPRVAPEAGTTFSLEPAGLLPLTDPVAPIHGFHDMPRIPNGPVPTRQVPADEPQPNIDLPVLRWDWGLIPRKPVVQVAFPIQNTGTNPLLITSVVTSCGCTTADLSSSLIPPGTRADLLVVFDPNFHETSGLVTRIIWLETNDPDMPQVELRLDANVAP